MLKVLRKKDLMKKLLWAVAIIIIIVFGLLSKASLLSNQNQTRYAGKLFGKKIPIDKFIKHYREVEIQAKLRLGENYEKMVNFIPLENLTWERIILLMEAEKRRIKIPDKEVIQVIQTYPLFQNEGQFDKNLYDRILYHFRIKPREFEEWVRNSIKFERIFEEETFNISVSEEEVWEAYKDKNEKVQINYVPFETEQFMSQVTPDQRQIKNYYDNYKNDFISLPMIDVEYVRIDYPEDIQNLLTQQKDLEQEQTTSSSDKNDQSSYLIKEAQETMYQKAYNMVEALRKNESLEQVAQEYNLEVQTSGFFSMEQPKLIDGWSFPLIQKIFEIPPGEIIGPIETAQGYQILKIRAQKDSYIPDYAEAKDKVQKVWLNKQAKILAKQQAEKALSTIQEIIIQYKRPDFAHISKEAHLEMQQTPLFTRGQYLPTIGISKDFQDTAFSLTEKARLSNVVDIEKGYAILFLDSIVPVDKETYQQEKDSFAEELLSERKNIEFNNYMTSLRKKANLDNNLPQLMGQEEPTS